MAAAFQISATSDAVDGDYLGSVHVSAMDSNGTVLDYGTGRNDGSPTQVSILVRGRGTVDYQFRVENDVSSTVVHDSIIALGKCGCPPFIVSPLAITGQLFAVFHQSRQSPETCLFSIQSS